MNGYNLRKLIVLISLIATSAVILGCSKNDNKQNQYENAFCSDKCRQKDKVHQECYDYCVKCEIGCEEHGLYGDAYDSCVSQCTDIAIFYSQDTQVPVNLFSKENVDIPNQETVLIAGVDNFCADIKRTDSIIVCNVSFKDKFASCISIPRDTIIDFRQGRRDKIAAMYAYGGSVFLLNRAEHFLNVKIDGYVILNIESAKRIIDAVGGVYLYIEKNLYYRDRSQDLFINLKQGNQHLNGEQAMQYAMFRHDTMGDFGRIQRQQKLIKSLLKNISAVDVVKALPKVIQELIGNKAIETNFSMGEITQIISMYSEDTSWIFNFYQLPGEPRDGAYFSYVEPDKNEMEFMTAALLRGGYHPNNKDLKVQIINSTGSTKAGDVCSSRLSYFGFNIVGINSSSSKKGNVVVERKKNQFSSLIAQLFDAELRIEHDKNSPNHIELIIGQ